MEVQTFINNNNSSNKFSYKKIPQKNKYKYLKNKYLYYIIILTLVFILMFWTFIIKNENTEYKKFINDCKQLKRFNIKKILNNENPYLSICIPVHNMEKYLERAILSIINQSFQDFEIIIVNDNSNDNTLKIMKMLQLEDNRITIVNHFQNLGVYSSRVDAILNAKGKYIILMDPDDMFLNSQLFEKLFNYNLPLNLDIIEFSVIYQEDRKKTIYQPKFHFFNHYHNFGKNIIYQPELSNIIFYIPQTNNYTSIICRTIWNKLIRRTILLESIDYINKDFNNKYLITADDTPINIMIFQNANNYSNINLPGYLYNLRTNSMSRGNNGRKHEMIVSINYLLYYKFFYRYIIDYKKDLNYLFYDMKLSDPFLLKIKDYKLEKYFPILNSFIYRITKNENVSKEFKDFLYNILAY